MFSSRLRKLVSRPSKPTQRSRRFRPLLEELEQRRLLATFTVNSDGDQPDGDLSDTVCDTGSVQSGLTGLCTLRAALENANKLADVDLIRFNIPGAGVHTIRVGTGGRGGLPEAIFPVIINGYQGGERTEIEGTNAGGSVDGLTLSGGNSMITGMVINRFSDSGILLRGGGTDLIIGNYLGTDADGQEPLPNGNHGIALRSGNHTIGGPGPLEPNVISGNGGDGISFQGPAASGSRVVGNFIGTNRNGTAAVPNRGIGVHVFGAANNVIGGPGGNRNVISGNRLDGLTIQGASATGNVVENNYLGTNAAGSQAVRNGEEPNSEDTGVRINDLASANIVRGNLISGNSNDGVRIDTEAFNNQVLDNLIGTKANGTEKLPNLEKGLVIRGGAHDNRVINNVISGNIGSGVEIEGGATRNSLGDNFIGTDRNERRDLANASNGIHIFEAPSNDIGVEGPNVIVHNRSSGIAIAGSRATSNLVVNNFIGTNRRGDNRGNTLAGITIHAGASRNHVGDLSAGLGNTIAFNGLVGVGVDDGTGNRILSNSIFDNGTLGIDLDTTGVTPNDLRDPDGGANNRQNFPVIVSVTRGTGTTTVGGILNSTPGRRFTIQAFANSSRDPSGFGEGKTLLGTSFATTDGNGNATFEVRAAVGLGAAHVVTATATDPDGNTSEFGTFVIITDVDVHSSDRETFETPSVQNGGLLHFVTARQQNDVVLEAEIEPNTAAFRDLITWETTAQGITLTSPAVGDDRRTVSFSSNFHDGLRIPIQIKIGGAVVREVIAWVVSANIAGAVGVPPVVTPVIREIIGMPLRLGTRVHAVFTSMVNILPAEIIADPDRPRLEDRNVINPPGLGLAGGANMRWDVSRQIARRTITNATNPALDSQLLGRNIDYPRLPIGNDDTKQGDELTDPYVAGMIPPTPDLLPRDFCPPTPGINNAIGTLASEDTPFVTHSTQGGNVGHTYRRQLWFREFARLQLGPAETGDWFVISDPLPWRVDFQFHKIQVTEALWSFDVNGDGDMLDNVTEAMLGVDMNGDRDLLDNVGLWDNSGSTTANNNDGLPQPGGLPAPPPPPAPPSGPAGNEIPPLPGVMAPIVFGGPDPLLNIPRTFTGRAGQTVTVPVNLDLSDELEALDLALAYDTSRLEVLSADEVRRGSLTSDFDLFLVNHDAQTGTLRVGLGRTAGPIGGRGSGSVLEITFRIKDQARRGPAIINLLEQLAPTRTQLNEGDLVLIPAPSNEAGDVLDGLINLQGDSLPAGDTAE